MNTAENVVRVARLVGRVAALVPAVNYAALGGFGAAVGVASEASATPIHVVALDNLNIPSNIDGVYINVITGATNTVSGSLLPGWDLNPFSSSALSFFSPASPSGGVYVQRTGGGGVANLAVGTLVDATSLFGTPGTSTGIPFGNNAWVVNATDIFGFRFIDEGDSLVHYGWASIHVAGTTAAQPRSIGELWYESQAGVGIVVSEPTSNAAPEPATGLLLASGIAGLLALRRRRRAH